MIAKHDSPSSFRRAAPQRGSRVACGDVAGCLIPNPPDKKSIGNMDVNFVEARRKELDDYLVR